MARRLRALGVGVAMALSERPMGAQMKRSEKLAARFAVFVGEKEIGSGRFGVKDLATGEQVELSEIEIVPRVTGWREGERG